MSVWGMQIYRSKFSFAPIQCFAGRRWERMADGANRFKAIAGLVKETKQNTKEALQTLCKM
jgi:hypothetical protein